MAIKIKKSELDKLIMEEALKYKKAISLKKQLTEIEAQLKEVTVGTEMSPGPEGYHAGQKKPVFATKGNPNLRMEVGDEGMEAEIGAEAPAEEMSPIAKAAADFGQAIADAIGGGGAGAPEIGGDEELEFDEKDLGGDEVGGAEGAADEIGSEEGADTEVGGAEGDAEGADDEVGAEEDAVDETAGHVEGSDGENKKAPFTAKTEAAKPEEECIVAEDAETPIEGKSPAQAAKQDTVSDNMEKVKNVKESKETLAEAEKKRMAFLAGIIKG